MYSSTKSLLSARQQIKLVQEQQKLLGVAMQAAGTPIGLEVVKGLVKGTKKAALSPRQQIKLIQEKQKLLAIAMQAAGSPIGSQAVAELMLVESVENSLIDLPSPTLSETLEEVKAAGVQLTPGLVSKIKSSSHQSVRNAIAIFKTYPKATVKNSAGLFYTILVNENLQAS
ncbi:hypothetical protein NIES4071_22340 [Calothrix sp. NIES-4071]|nr:hypothetical protein NIES4071_22340 [Calothrix sp. NIES-4071]BAZ56566.1 hypothetical protein NIES4105_22290 [Calothrix sp. NIES-4105]